MSAETTAPDPANWLEYNRANWDERVPIHVDGSGSGRWSGATGSRLPEGAPRVPLMVSLRAAKPE